METNEMNAGKWSLNASLKRGMYLRMGLTTLFIFLLMFFSSNVVLAHCDTMDGPLIADARKAIEQNNVNYVLKWVPVADEAEVTTAFNLMMKVRGLSPEAKELADKYFFDTLVRIHRAGEGMPFTGVKPSGTPIDKKIIAADKSIEIGNISPLNGLVEAETLPELTKRFEKVMSLKKFNVNDVVSGREYIEAYVQFFKYAEGEEGEHPEK
jgi:hypothetical protein